MVLLGRNGRHPLLFLFPVLRSVMLNSPRARVHNLTDRSEAAFRAQEPAAFGASYPFAPRIVAIRSSSRRHPLDLRACH